MIDPEPHVWNVAREQFERLGAPTVVVPIDCGGTPGVLYASYQGDAAWMALAREPGNQVELAISCAKRAHAQARQQAGAGRDRGRA